MVLPILLILLFLGLAIFLPFRAKNPPERFPVVTLGLIALNVLSFALTSQYFLVVRESAVHAFALSHETLGLPRLLTSMFLHGSIFHLLGNMLFLWIFGGPVEGRLRSLPFLALYLTCGLAGGLLHDLVVGMFEPDKFMLGASGAIMGIAGAYLYIFPYSTICVFWLFRVMQCQARWIVLLYIGQDIMQGLGGSGGGTAHFAHIGGFGVGLLTVWLLRVRRDGEEFSNAQATVSDMRDYNLMTLYEMEPLMQQAAPPPKLALAYCQKALLTPGARGEEQCVAALRQHGRMLVESGDACALAAVLLGLPPAVAAQNLPLVFFLRLGSRLERENCADLATRLYRRICEINMRAPDAEVALYRTGRLLENVYRDREGAKAYYGELLRLFPNGQMALDARRSLAHL